MARPKPGDTDPNAKKKVSWQELKESFAIFKYVKPYRVSFILGMILLALSSLSFMVIMGIPGEIVNVVDGKPKYGYSLNELFAFLMILLAIQSVVSYFRVQTFAVVSENGIADMRRDLYRKLITLEIPFFEQHRVGELTSRITNDTNQLYSIFSITLAEVFRQIILLVVGLVMLVVQFPKLTLSMLLTFPVVIIVALFFGRFIRKVSKERQDKMAEANVVVDETMQSINSVKAYTNEKFEVGRFVNANEAAVKVSMRAAHYRGLMASFIILAMFGALFFVMWRAALLVQSGDLASGDLFSFVLLTVIIGASVAGLGSFYPEVVSAVGATERIREILRMPSEVDTEKINDQPVPRFKGEISYENVRFSYPSRNDVEVLKDISLHVAPGQKIALVGTSGSGKSTIVQLLLRFYPLTEGKLTVDGQSIYDYDVTAFRKNIAIVPQEVLLFGGSIRENIAYGKPGASDDEIIEAARSANAWDFISAFPDGLNTLVGERGIKLSGGQRQRIAIARAILKNPAILVLDEATSSLDAESEKVVQEALDKLMEGRTSIIIAHRLSTIREVDCIYVIDKGHIAEKGTHEELSNLENGIYNGLARLQFTESNA